MNLKRNRRIGNWMAAIAVVLFVTAMVDSASAQSAKGRFDGPSSNLRRIQPASTQNALKAMLKKLSSTDDANEKSKLEQEIKQLLNGQYDKKMDAYEKHLTELEGKLEKMRSQLQKRRDAKSDMVGLRMKVLMAEADDLGWPSDLPGAQKPSNFPAAFGLGSKNVPQTNGGFVASPFRGLQQFGGNPQVPLPGPAPSKAISRWGELSNGWTEELTTSGSKKGSPKKFAIEAGNIEELKAASERFLKEFEAAKANAEAKAEDKK